MIQDLLSRCQNPYVNDLINSSFIEINNGKHLCSIECADDVNINLKNFINR